MALFKTIENKDKELKERKITETLRFEKQKLEREFKDKTEEVGLTKMMANREVYKEIMIIQNETIISMLTQLVLANESMISNAFALSAKDAHKNKIEAVLRKFYSN
jgi:hypothetical protein|tara:strand:+ start:225 stop:542 length:318 start_codon:yes stop_codon:yes gene_type:complete